MIDHMIELMRRHFSLINTLASLANIALIANNVARDYGHDSIYLYLGFLAANILAGFLYPYAAARGEKRKRGR